MEEDNEIFLTIKSSVLKWVEDNKVVINNHGVKIEEVECNENIYKAFFDFKNCIGELLVTKPHFAPYRFISIQIVSLEDTHDPLIYYWYDNEKTSNEEIIANINKFIDFGVNFTFD